MTTTIKTNPHRAVDYSESGVTKALAAAGSLEAEVKYDGVRLNLPVFPTGETQWLSRESKPLPALSWLAGSGAVFKQADDWRWFLKQAGYEGTGLMIDGEVMVKGVDFNTSSGLIRTKYVKSKNYDFHDGDWDIKSKTTQFRLDRARIKVVVYGFVS